MDTLVVDIVADVVSVFIAVCVLRYIFGILESATSVTIEINTAKAALRYILGRLILELCGLYSR
jgi:hypothetical protein